MKLEKENYSKGVVKKIKSKAKINVKRILQIEDKVKHDVIAFLTSISEKAEKARYCINMTSSDVLILALIFN